MGKFEEGLPLPECARCGDSLIEEAGQYKQSLDTVSGDDEGQLCDSCLDDAEKVLSGGKTKIAAFDGGATVYFSVSVYFRPLSLGD